MCTRLLLVLLLLTVVGVGVGTAADADDKAQRQRMVQEIEAEVKLTSARLVKSALHTRVLEVMRTVPRHAFVPSHLRHLAYTNRPLPIGHGQTISQPYIVAVMTDLLGVNTSDTVLEVGTGSGYQTAILAELTQRVYSVEIIKDLAVAAQERLRHLGYTNVEVRVGDGYYGWEERAPFDAIIVTAAASHIPPSLLAQLKPGGRMVIPVGSTFMTQQLVWVDKDQQGRVRMRQVLPVAFVPLMGKP